MEERDFTWCYNHENLFRSWVARFYDIDGFYADAGFDSDSIFSLWQTAKECALEIANSKEPGLLYRIRRKEIKAKMPDNFCYIMQFLNFMLMSTKGNIMNSIFYNCSNLLETYLSTHKVEDDDEYAKIVKNANDELFLVWGCSDQINSDYDYSLPDGGIKDETETDETITKTIMKTDAGTAENNETLLEELTPIFYGNKEQAEDYIQKIKNITKDVEKIRYTAQLVNENTISEMSCHRDLYSILHDHRLYNKSESNWNKVISQHLVKK